LYKIFLEQYTINSNPRFTTDLRIVGAEGSLLLVVACSLPRPRPRVDLVAGSLLLLVVVVFVVVAAAAAGSLLL
jgi:hypothetical protein